MALPLDVLLENSRILAEPEFKYRLAQWHRPCVDATFHLTEVRRNCKIPNRRFPGEPTLDFILANFRPANGGGGFGQHAKSKAPTINATYCAIKALQNLLKPDPPESGERRYTEAIKKIGPDKLHRIKQLLMERYDPPTGGFFDIEGSPTDNHPLVSTTGCAVGLILLLEMRDEFADKIAHSIDHVMKCGGKTPDGGFGFRQSSDKDSEYLGCTTYFAVKLIRNYFGKGSREFGEFAKRYGAEIVKFLLACELGARKGMEPSLIHARFVQQGIRLLAERTGSDQEQDTRLANSIYSLIAQCKTYGGFGFSPGAQANAYALRTATDLVGFLSRQHKAAPPRNIGLDLSRILEWIHIYRRKGGFAGYEDQDSRSERLAREDSEIRERLKHLEIARAIKERIGPVHFDISRVVREETREL